MNKSYLFKQIAIVLCCIATASFSSNPLTSSGGSAGSLSAATATAAAVATAAAHSSDSKTMKDAAESPATVRTQGSPTQFTFSPNGRFISVLTTAGIIQTFEIDSATGTFTPVQRNIFAGPSSRRIFYLSDDLFITQHNNQIVTAQNFLSGAVTQLTLNDNDPILSIAVSQTKKLVAIGNGSSKVHLCRFDPEKQSMTFLANSPFKLEGQDPDNIALSPSGNIVSISGFVHSGGNQTSFYRLNSATGTLKHITGSPVETSYRAQITFSPDDTLCFHVSDGESTIRVFALDPIQGITEQASCPSHEWVTSIAVSPDSRFVVDTNAGLKREITVHAVDSVTKTIKPIEGSQVKTGFFPGCTTYAPSGDLAVVANQASQSISIYEVDQPTGRFTPLTGELLQSVLLARRTMALAREVLVDHGPVVHEIIARYLGAIYDKPAAAAIEKVTEADVAIAKTQKEADPKTMQETRVQLFQAIAKARFEEIAPLLTPFTVNARDEDMRTPLMHAVRHNDTDSIVEQLLQYKGEKQYNVHKKEAVTVDLNAVDYDGNTALIHAVKNARFKAAAMLAQKMSKDGIAKAIKEGKTALILAQEMQAKYADSADYQALMKLLAQ